MHSQLFRIISFLCLICVVSLGCGGGGGGSGSLTGGDDAGDSGAGDTGTEAGAGTFETDAPIDLPAPIAKGLDGVDPTSVQFTPTSGTPGVVGTLTAATIGNIDATVAIIRSGEIYARQKTTGGRVEFEIPTELLGETVALVVLAEDEETVSPPVLVQISQFSGSDEPTVDVLVTNTSVIQNQRIAVSSDGTVAFSAVDSSSEPFIGTVSVNGGTPSVLTEDLTDPIIRLDYRANGDLWGTDSASGLIVITDSNGNQDPFTETLEDFTDPADSLFSLSPDDGWVLSSKEVKNALKLDLTNPDEIAGGKEIMVTEGTVVSLQFDWLTDDVAIVAKEFSDGTYAVQTYSGLNQFKTSFFTTTVTTATLLTSGVGSPLANPQANRTAGDRFGYECGQADGKTGLCIYMMNTGVSMTPDTGDVARQRWADDGSYGVYETDSGSGLDDCTGIIYISSVRSKLKQ